MIATRNRTLRFAGLITGALILLALMTATGFHFHGKTQMNRAMDKVEKRFGPLDPAEFTRPPVPDQLNATAWLLAGAGAVVWSDEEREVISEASLLPYGDWSAEMRTAVGTVLEHHEPALNTLHRAAPLKKSSFAIQYDRGMDAEIPDVLSLVRASRLLMAEAHLAFADGDQHRGLVALATLSRMATALEEESLLVTALVGLAIERAFLVTATEITGAAWAGEPALLDQLEAIIPATSTTGLFHRQLAFEASVIGSPEFIVATRIHTRLFGRQALARIVEQRLEMLELLTIPCGTNPDRFDPQQIRNLPKPGNLPELFTDKRRFLQSIGRFQAVKAQRQLLRAAIAMRRIATNTGSYPEERPQLGELSEPDAFTGKPISYTLHDDGSLELALVGAPELLERFVAGKSVANMLTPVVLPPPNIAKAEE